MKHNVKITMGKDKYEKTVEAGTNLFNFLRKNSFMVDSLCGGKGLCGKCRVKIFGDITPPSGKEAELLGEDAIKNNYRLACYIKIESDMEVIIEDTVKEAAILIEGKQRVVKLQPYTLKNYVKLNKPDINDQKSDIERISDISVNLKKDNFPGFINELPSVIRKNDYGVTLVSMGDSLVSVEPGDTTERLYGIAIDIGTTTIAAYLYNLCSGERVDVFSILNPQKKYGADVISRIEYTMGSEEAIEEMTKTIIDCINEIAFKLAERNKINLNDIYTCVFVGNTTMMHFLMGLDARNIAVSPFIPVTTELHSIKAVELGIKINPFGYAVIIPCVAGYVGADTVAAALSTGLYEDDQISLLIDIGTNGEIVLGSKEWMYSCSTAAGPAFEGANIRNGVRAVKGAIDKVFLSDDVKFTTIQKAKPMGICGSGLVDAIAGMYDTGVIDGTGRIVDADEDPDLPVNLSKRIIDVDGSKAFLLVSADETTIDSDIVITQKDIRELQNAKAAIAAGIRVLINRAETNFDDIKKVHLAGGFGNYIDIDSALVIGLLPEELKGRIEGVGNAAGSGAIEALLSIDMLKQTDIIRKKIKYIELSASPDFTDEYIENMVFGEDV